MSYKQKVIRVPEDDAEWFETTYPAYGSWTWFVQTALSRFREAHEVSPNDLVQEASELTLAEKTEEDNARRNFAASSEAEGI